MRSRSVRVAGLATAVFLTAGCGSGVEAGNDGSVALPESQPTGTATGSTAPETPPDAATVVGTGDPGTAPKAWRDVTPTWVPDGFELVDDQRVEATREIRDLHYTNTSTGRAAIVVSIYEPDPEVNPGGRRVGERASTTRVRGRPAVILRTAPEGGVSTLLWEERENYYLTVSGRGDVSDEMLKKVAEGLEVPR